MRMVDRRHHAFALGGASGQDGVLRVSAGARGLDIGFLKRIRPCSCQCRWRQRTGRRRGGKSPRQAVARASVRAKYGP